MSRIDAPPRVSRPALVVLTAGVAVTATVIAAGFLGLSDASESSTKCGTKEMASAQEIAGDAAFSEFEKAFSSTVPVRASCDEDSGLAMADGEFEVGAGEMRERRRVAAEALRDAGWAPLSGPTCMFKTTGSRQILATWWVSDMRITLHLQENPAGRKFVPDDC